MHHGLGHLVRLPNALWPPPYGTITLTVELKSCHRGAHSARAITPPGFHRAYRQRNPEQPLEWPCQGYESDKQSAAEMRDK